MRRENRPHRHPGFNAFSSFLFLAGLFLVATPAAAQVSLGSAQQFGVLAGSTVTNTGPSSIDGDVGVWPGTAIVGFPPGTTTGSLRAGDAVAQQAQTDLTAAYNAAAGTACNTNLTGQDLGGMTLTPGVYCFDSSAGLTGTLTLDFLGNPNAFFLFKIGSTLTTASASMVQIINGGGTTCPPNVFWQVGSSATLGTGSTFRGNIMALTSITLTTGASLDGRALARNGAVTLDSNTVIACGAIVACPLITLSPATLPNATVGSPYSATIVASGGTAPYTYSVSSGSLPAGLTLNANTGEISGTPTAAAISNFTITATDAVGCLGSRAYSIIVAPNIVCPEIMLSPATLPNATVGSPYSATIVASGGTAPYTYVITAGSLPAGLNLNATTGVISGSPTAAATSNFTVTATDAAGCPGSRAYSINVVCPVITLSPTTLPNATVGVPYSATVVASGGTAPYTYTVSLGALPAGLTLNATTGVISGTPTAAVTSNFTIMATDAFNCPVTRAYSIVGAVAPEPVPTLEFYGMAALFLLLAGVGLFVMNRF
jgi:hypothetical protein